MQLPVVTVVIPNHNDATYISQAIKSAANQDYPGLIQICVVDDGSTDDSWDIILKCLFGEADVSPEVVNGNVVVDQEGVTAIKRPEAGGPSAARNTAIEYTIENTHIYAMLDSDDEFYSDKVSKCVAKIMEDPLRIGAVYGDYDILHISDGRIIRDFKEPFDKARLLNECIIHSGSVVNNLALKATYEATGFYDVNMRVCEDYDLWMRISEQFVFVHIPESLTLVRVTSDNSSFIINQDTWAQNWRRVMEKAQQRRGVQP